MKKTSKLKNLKTNNLQNKNYMRENLSASFLSSRLCLLRRLAQPLLYALPDVWVSALCEAYDKPFEEAADGAAL